MDPKKKAAPGANRAASDTAFDKRNRTAPKPTGQCGFVLDVVRKNPGIKSLTITADMAVPECAARIHDLRAAGWNIVTVINPVVVFRGVKRRNVASYSLASPEWPRPGFLEGASESGQLGLDLGRAE